MESFKKIKFLLLIAICMITVFTVGNTVAFANENIIESGIYEVENDVYHESEVGMGMSRSYLVPTMEVEVRKGSIVYTVAFSGSEYMENYRMKVNEEEVPVEILEGSEDGIVKLKFSVDKVDADMKAMIYIGPMERDVEFKVIPKMETLNLIEAIEEPVKDVVEEIEEEGVDVVAEEDATTSASKKLKNSAILLGSIGGALVLLVVAAVVFVKVKRK